ncbi:MAG: ankyrin repeat domain-containing protein [Chloroflexi bacterium]|nr:ankyrin repeat domain-containing protein [Chloroflexota bacterium]
MHWLHQRGADVNGAAHIGMTGLHLAAMRQRVDVARWLIERGADPSLRDGIHHRTALGWPDGRTRDHADWVI